MADQRIARDVLDYGGFTDSAGIIRDSVATVKEVPTTDIPAFFAYGEFASSPENSEKENAAKASSVCNDVLDYGEFSCAETPLPAVEQEVVAKSAAARAPVIEDGLDAEPPILGATPDVKQSGQAVVEPAAAQPPVLEARPDAEPAAQTPILGATPAVKMVEPPVSQPPVLDARPETKRAEHATAEISAQRHTTHAAFPGQSKTGAHDPRRIKVVFPIGAKLTACITGVALCSLGSLAAAGWLFIGADARRTAERHNAEINCRATLVAETALSSVKNNVSMLFYGLDPPKPETVSSFFEEHPAVAAILSGGYAPGEREERRFIHERFFLNHGIDASLITACMERMGLNNKVPRMEPALLNAAPFFEGAPLLAMRFPADRGWIAVFFSSERLAESFGGSENASLLLNRRGDVLVHAEQDVIMQESNGFDFSTAPVLREFVDSGKTALQTRYVSTGGDACIAAIRRLNTSDDDLFALTVIPEAVVFENNNAILRLNLYLSLAAGLVALIVMRFFSKTISVPLKVLKSAVQAVEDGNYSMTDTSCGDEIGLLTESVNDMIRTLANVESFANQKIARRLWKGLLQAEGTRKEATVFFSSLWSFMENIENTDNPEETVALLNEYLDRMSACITLTGGVVDKYIGATVMAHWGAADSADIAVGNAEQNAVNAVCAALMMRAAMRSLNDSLNEAGVRGKTILRAGCGLNSGDITAAQIGSSGALEYTVMGDTVTRAKRAKDFCETLGAEIVITENTRDLIKDSFIIENLPPIRDKGKEIRLFAVVNTRNITILERIFSTIEQTPKTNSHTSRLCLGPGAPQNMAELRRMLGLSAPDISKATH
ncbi:MAG: HAMP domain-containing protein [Treponema sp.]|nr:HAMP domain-containing protein [Treponema sp.]